MKTFERIQKAEERYRNMTLQLPLDPDSDAVKKNRERIQEMQETLKAFGIQLQVTNDQIRITVQPQAFSRARTRNAGRPEKALMRKSDYHTYRYADIVNMMQTMTGAQIAKILQISEATYYRKKKKLVESPYFKRLDQSRSEDLSYLNSVEGNEVF